MTVPGAKANVTNHSGLLLVYSEAERATALLASQSPSAAIEPEILIVSPYVVVTVSSNVTATEVAVVQAVALVVVLLAVVVVDFELVDPIK
jgi:hypothetical protein